jgi:hypothetical protein
VRQVRAVRFFQGLKSLRICSMMDDMTIAWLNVAALLLKVDMPDEVPTIHNVRGAGFILRAAS